MTREEAIEVVRKNLPHLGIGATEMTDALGTLIPELRESEDERIRRTLVEYFGPKVQLDFVRGVPIQKIRDWLEKQKEKSEIPIMDGDTDTYFDDLRMTTKPLTSREWFDEGIKYAQRLQKEQKQEWSEEDKEKIVTISEIIEHCTTIPYSGGTLTLNKEYKKELLCFIRTLHPSWKPSEEQMKALKRASTNEYLSAKQFDILVSLYEQLKKL